MCQFIIETGKEYQEENSKVSFKSICLSSMQFLYFYDYIFPSGSMMKNLPANTRATGDVVSSPVSGRSPEEEKVIHSSILACKIQWTEEPSRPQSMGLQTVGSN